MPHNKRFPMPPVFLTACCLLTLLTLLSLLTAPALGRAAPPTTLHLNMAIPYNEQHPVQTEVFLPWAETIRRQSDGAINITIFDALSLLIEADTATALVTGSLTLGVILPGSAIPSPPVSTLLDFYLDAPNTRTASRIVWDCLQFHPALKAEFQLIHILWAWASSPSYIHSIAKPIHTIDDMQDLRWLVWSDSAEEFVTSVGGIPVRCLPAESAQMLLQNMADGILCPIPPLISFGINSHIRFTTDLPLLYFSFYMGMNKEVWDALPPTSQKLFTETTGRKISAQCGLVLDKTEAKIRSILQQKNHVFVPASKDFQQACQDRIAPLRQARFIKIQSLNIPNMNDFRPLIREIREDIKREDAGTKH